MNVALHKFFIGLMEFLSILLPGPLLTWLLIGEVGLIMVGIAMPSSPAPAWAGFLFTSYLFGHLVFLLGSWLDELDDWARRYTLNTQITLRARALVWPASSRERNLNEDCVGKIKQLALDVGSFCAERVMRIE